MCLSVEIFSYIHLRQFAVFAGPLLLSLVVATIINKDWLQQSQSQHRGANVTDFLKISFTYHYPANVGLNATGHPFFVLAPTDYTIQHFTCLVILD